MFKPSAYRFGLLAFFAASVAVAVSNIAHARGAAHSWVAQQSPMPSPSYISWYTASPVPIPSGDAAIGAAFGVRSVYNAISLAQRPAGNAMVDAFACFVCYGAPGQASHHILAYGND